MIFQMIMGMMTMMEMCRFVNDVRPKKRQNPRENSSGLYQLLSFLDWRKPIQRLHGDLISSAAIAGHL